jgi:hypothetical protein
MRILATGHGARTYCTASSYMLKSWLLFPHISFHSSSSQKIKQSMLARWNTQQGLVQPTYYN